MGDRLDGFTNASSGQRFKAFLWDSWFIVIRPNLIGAIVFAVLTVLTKFFGVDEGVSSPAVTLTIATSRFLGAALPILFMFTAIWDTCKQISKTGQTLGKRKMGIAIVMKKTGKHISVISWIGRNLILGVVVGLFIGWLTNFVVLVPHALFLLDIGWILFDKNGEAIHDKIWGTRVVRINK